MNEWDKKKSLKVIKFLESKLSTKIEDIQLTIKTCVLLQDFILDRYILDNNSGPIFIGVMIYYIYALLEDTPYYMGRGIISLLNKEYASKYTMDDWKDYIIILIDNDDITYNVIRDCLTKP